MSQIKQPQPILPKAYLQYFQSKFKSQSQANILKDAATSVGQILLDSDKLRQYKISIRKSLPQQLFCTEITPVYFSNTLNGSIVESKVRIGYFTVEYNMIFVNTNAPENNMRRIGKGAFGTIHFFKPPNTELQHVAKRIKIQDNLKAKSVETRLEQHIKLKDAIMEFAIYKIADLFEIGPKVVNFGFDLVCYNNAVEFYLEKCEDVTSIDAYRLKYCVRVLHSISITHKDIKPENLLMSKTKGRMVLSDFGLSEAIKQKIGEKTNSFYCGTQGFLGESMKKIRKGKKGFIDLFKNDLESTTITLNNIQQSSEDWMQSNQRPSSSVQSEQQVPTNSTSYVPQTPVEYQILYAIYTLFSKNKCLDFIEYDWIKFQDNLPEEKKSLLNEMIGRDIQHKKKNMIYCYGYSSKLLEKMYKVDRQLYEELKIHFENEKVQVYLNNDFNYRFIKIFSMAKQLKYSDTTTKTTEQQKKNNLDIITHYQKLQFLIMNEFKSITHSKFKKIKQLQSKMKKIRMLNSLDYTWDLAILFIEICVGDGFDRERGKKTRQIIGTLKQLNGENYKKLFEDLIDMITLSYCSPNSSQKVQIYTQLIKIQSFLSPAQRLLNKSILLKSLPDKQSSEYLSLFHQIQLSIKPFLLYQPIKFNQKYLVQYTQKQLLIESLAIYSYESQDYLSALSSYQQLKSIYLLQFDMSQEMIPILYSLADCYFKLSMYREVTATYREIRNASGEILLEDYQIIGYSHFMLGNPQRAKKYYTDCYNLMEDEEQRVGGRVGKCEYWIGRCWMEMMIWGEAVKCFENCRMSKEEKRGLDVEYYDAGLRILECQTYLNIDEPLSYFSQKYHLLLAQLHTVPLSSSLTHPLLTKTLLLLQILYQLHNAPTQRKLTLSRLSSLALPFSYTQDDLFQRSAIYFSLNMLEKAFIYSYAAGLKLKGNNDPEYVENRIVERKEKIGKVLGRKNKEFKEMWGCLRYKREYEGRGKERIEMERELGASRRLRELLGVLEGLYERKREEEMREQTRNIEEGILKRIKEMGEEEEIRTP